MSRLTPTYVAVVDDDDSLCRSLGRLLRAAGLQPVTYSSAEAFLADEKCPRFDCLLLDVQLGGMSGIGHNVPVIFITALDDPDTRIEAEASGCAAYFSKTDAGADVLAAIRRLAG
jgi:FixJ family two-component response regulator